MSNGAERDRDLVWELVDSRDDRDYHLFSVKVTRNRSPRDGAIHEFQILSSNEWVVMIPLDGEGRVVMVRQYRHGSGEISLEVPGGLVKTGATPEQSALEELEEETGYLAPNPISLGWMYPMPALFTNRMHVYYAQNVTPTGTLNPDDTEALKTEMVPLDRIRPLIREGVIDNALMIAALYRFLDHFENVGLGAH